MTMELGLQTMTSSRRTLEMAALAEARGLAAFAVADHYLSGPSDAYALDQLTLLGAVATATQDIELSTLVSPITFRHPAVMLKAAVTVAELSGGRFTLGVGAGWMREEHELFGLPFPETGERFDMLTEALSYLRAAIDPEAPGFEGTHYRLAAGTAPQPGGPNLRLVVGGGGASRTPTLAGRFADEFNAFPAEAPFDVRINRAKAAAAEAGREPDDLFVTCAFPLVVGATQSEVEMRMAEVGRRRGVDPDDIRPRWSSLGIPVGTVDEVSQGLDHLESIGIRRVYFQVAFDDVDAISRSIDLLAG